MTAVILDDARHQLASPLVQPPPPAMEPHHAGQDQGQLEAARAGRLSGERQAVIPDHKPPRTARTRKKTFVFASADTLPLLKLTSHASVGSNAVADADQWPPDAVQLQVVTVQPDVQTSSKAGSTLGLTRS